MSDFKIDFCGVGGAKAGTTWVFRQLKSHPQTCIGRRKELNFFMRNHPLAGTIPRTGSHFDSINAERGLDWYAQQFDWCQPGQIKGELSTSYLADPESPRLLYEHNPDLKLILNYRNPVDALYSVYWQLNEAHEINETFEELVERAPQAPEYYMWSKHTKAYLDVFPREQILFMFLDDLKVDADKVYQDLCAYLGIDAVELDTVHKKVNPSKMVRSKAIRNLSLKFYYLMDINPTMRKAREWMRRKKLTKVAGRIRRWNSVTAKYPPMKRETRARLIEIFREDIEELGRMHDRDLSHWLTLPDETEGQAG